MNLLTAFSESVYLSSRIAILLARYFLDRLFSSSLNLSLPVVTRFFKGATGLQSINPSSEGGAGGNGTTRDWLVITADGIQHDVFGKTATTNTIETFFLNLFDVYANELRFYNYIKGITITSSTVLPPDFFPKVYAAELSFFKSSFLLLVENVDKTRSTATTTISFPQLASGTPHPIRRVLAVLDTQACLHAEYFMRPPACAWNPDRRPPFLQIISQSTKDKAAVRFAEVLNPKILREYGLFLIYHDVVRKFWDTGPVTLVHGDAHLGNYFFAEEMKGGEIIKTTARMYDFQCTAHEHPVRDVAYHILCSVDAKVIDEFGGDKKLLEYYVDKFNEYMTKREGFSNRSSITEYLSIDEAWKQYRLHAFWVLTAFVISAAPGDLFDFDKAIFIIGRIVAACERISAGDELVGLLKASGISISPD